MALTPIGEALNRATPGFDALVGALQNTANRITQNKQFAKEVQAREDFAKFQANLNLKNRLEIMKASSASQKEYFDYTNQKELGENGYLAQRLDIQTDADINKQEDLIDLNIERGPDIAESEAEKQRIISENTRDVRRDDLEMQTDVATDALRTRIQEGLIPDPSKSRSNTNQVNIQDWIKQQKEDFRRPLSDELIQDDIHFVYHEPTIVETEDGQLSYNPVPVTVNNQTKVISWSAYENEYVPINKQRFNIKQQVTDILQNKTHLIEETATGGQRGVKELKQLLQDIEQIEGAYEAMGEFLNNFGGINAAYIDSDTKDSVREAEEYIYQVKPLFDPIKSPILDEGDRIAMPRTMSVDSPEYGEFVMELDERIDEFKWTNLVDRVKQLDEGTEQTSYLSAFQELSKQFANVENVPTGFRELVLNWDFDANQPHSDSNKLFLTTEQAKSKLLRQATKNFNSPDVNRLNTKTPAQIQFEQRKLRD